MSQNMNCKVLLAKYFLLELLFQEKKKVPENTEDESNSKGHNYR